MMTRLADLWLALLTLLDIANKSGPSFSKLMIVVVVMHAITTGGLSNYIATLVICASFGRSTLMALVNRSAFSVSSSDSRTRTETQVAIAERRDQSAGVEPAP